MQQHWIDALREYERLMDLPDAEADVQLATLRASDATLAKLVDDMRREPALTLRPIGSTGADAELDDGREERVASDAQNTGRRLGAYTLIREIGRGGMGSVWLAERADGRFEGKVAIKLLSNAALRAPSARERFKREGELLAKLAHPHIARMIDAGLVDEDVPYLVLEHVHGVTIQHYCKEHALGFIKVVELFCQVLEAVAYAHSMLVLHRDIKPANILVTATGDVKLLDFGLGRLLDADTANDGAGDLSRIAGLGCTPRYAPPEQLKGDAVGTASDVYSLGITLYELLTGESPDDRQHYTRPSEKLAVSPARSHWSKIVKGDIDSIVAKAINQSPKDRYANAAAMKDDLLRFLNDEPVTAQPDTGLYRAGKFVRRHQFAVGSTVGAVLLVLAAFSVSVLQTVEAHRQRDEADRQRARAQSETEQRDKTIDFVVQLISNHAPQNAPLTTAQLLDIGIAKIPEVFKADYLTSANVAKMLAIRFYEMGEPSRARRGLEDAHNYALKQSDAATIVDSKSFLAEFHANNGNVKEAARLMREAVALLPLIPASNPSRRGIEETLLFDQVIIAWKSGDAPIALATAEKLMASRNQGGDNRKHSESAAWIRVMLANRIAMRFTEAVAANDKAVEQLVQVGAGDGLSANAAFAGRLDLLLTAGDPDAAVSFIETRLQPTLKLPLAQVSDLLFQAVIRSYAQHGQLAIVQRLLNERATPGDMAALAKLRLAYARFETCVVSADAPCAQQFASQAAEMFVQSAPGNPAVLVGRRWVQAVNARLGGDDAAAMEAIATGLKEVMAHTLSPSPFYAPLLVERARVETKRGNLETSYATAREGLDYLERNHRYDPKRCLMRAELLSLGATALQNVGRTAEAQPLRDESDVIFRTLLSPAHPRFKAR